MQRKIIATSDAWETLDKLVRSGVTYPKLEHIAYRLDGKGQITRKVYKRK